MKEGGFLENLSPEEQKRMAYVEGAPFRTSVFEIEKNEGETSTEIEKNVVVVSRDPGSANALCPVVELLQKEDNIGIKLVTDGRAQQLFQKKFKTKDITPEGNILEAAGTLSSPDIALIDSSVGEIGIEMFFSATFPEVPVVLVEDYYTSSVPYLKRLKESNLPFPKKICVIDEGAKDILVKKFPEVADSIEVTGQPSFDRFAREDTEKIAGDVKKELGIKPEEILVTYMSSAEKNELELIQRLSEELAKVGKAFKFTYRRHPRDNTSLEQYEAEIKKRKLDYVRTMDLPTDKIGAASDLVINTISTEGLNAIYRRKPSININDPRFTDPYEDLIPPPSVRLGASAGIEKIEELADCVKKLLDPESKERKTLDKNMKKNYPLDGKNAKRVEGVLKEVLSK